MRFRSIRFRWIFVAAHGGKCIAAFEHVNLKMNFGGSHTFLFAEYSSKYSLACLHTRLPTHLITRYPTRWWTLELEYFTFEKDDSRY